MKRQLIRSRGVLVIDGDDLPRPTRADMRRLKGAMEGPIDTSDMPEVTDAAIRAGKFIPLEQVPRMMHLKPSTRATARRLGMADGKRLGKPKPKSHRGNKVA